MVVGVMERGGVVRATVGESRAKKPLQSFPVSGLADVPPQQPGAQHKSVAIRPHVQVVEGKLAADDLAVLTKWIELNHEVLLKYWEGEIDTKDAIDAIRQVKK